MNELDVEHENVFMKYFWFQPYRGMPIYRWYNNFKVGNITSYDVFEEKFLQDREVKYDRKYLMNQLYEIKKKDNGIVQLEFNQIFESVLEKIIHYIKPKDLAILIHYFNAFEGTFGFMLKEKNHTSLEDA